MTAWAKVLANRIACGKKPLRMTGRFEATHDSLPLTRGLMGILRPIVQAFVLAVLYAREHLLFSRAIARQLIRDQHTWDVLASLEQFPNELPGSLFVPSALTRISSTFLC